MSYIRSRKHAAAAQPGMQRAFAAAIARASRHARAVWCIFDNTAAGAALPNALELVARITPGR